MLYIESALFKHLATGADRLAACYHVRPRLISLNAVVLSLCRHLRGAAAFRMHPGHQQGIFERH